MRIAFLIAAHKNAEQVVRLVNRLDGRGISFFIHINKRTEEVFRAVFDALSDRPNVYWVERHIVKAGDIGLVLAFLSGIREVCERKLDVDFVISMSGQDYPIKSNSEIARILTEHAGKQLMEYVALPLSNWGGVQGGGMIRIQRYYFWIGERRVRIPPRRVPDLLWMKRKLPHGLKPYGGSAWWCLSGECIRYIDEFVQTQEGRDLVKFFRRTDISTEMFFQTVVMNSRLKDTVVDDDLRFIEWTGGPHPRTLGILDIEKLRASDKLFARKFDEEVDSDILDAIDRELCAHTKAA